jgi:wobble nucleotide-excising tRNase
MITSDRIIVIDDPISSLDSNILFIVSTLINNLKQRVRNNSNFKQLILLTHNVYFHKEISFNKGNPKLADEGFWILRKINDISQIHEYAENPIKNSYELLWRELKENKNSITAPNIMRRILENYFKFFGNVDIYEIIDIFPEDEKIVCYTLLSWANDGSHHIHDDLFVDNSQEQIEKYFTVFEKIFVNSDHHSHFVMMMGENLKDDQEDQSMVAELA